MRKLFLLLVLVVLTARAQFVSGTFRSGRMVAGGPRVPSDISNLQLWFDATTSLSGANGTAVSSWPDLSANGYNLGQPTNSNRPYLTNNASVINGRNWVRFLNTTNWMTNTTAFNFSQPCTYLCVSFWGNINANQQILFDSMDSVAGARQVVTVLNTAPINHGQMFSGGTVGNTPDVLTFNRWDYNVWQFSNTTATTWSTNGVDFGVTNGAGVGTLHGLTLGAKWNFAVPFQGGIAEFAMWNKVLSSNEVYWMKKYARDKYGIAGQ